MCCIMACILNTVGLLILSDSSQTWPTWCGCSLWRSRGTGMFGWSLCAALSRTRRLRTFTGGCWWITSVMAFIFSTSSLCSPDCSLWEEGTLWWARAPAASNTTSIHFWQPESVATFVVVALNSISTILVFQASQISVCECFAWNCGSLFQPQNKKKFSQFWVHVSQFIEKV